MTDFTNLSTDKKERVMKTIRVLQRLPNRCGLTYESMKFVFLPELDFELRTGKISFLEC